jgi:hypothetical protein
VGAFEDEYVEVAAYFNAPFVMEMDKGLVCLVLIHGVFFYACRYDCCYEHIPIIISRTRNYLVFSLVEESLLAPSAKFQIAPLLKNFKGGVRNDGRY